MCIFNLKCNVRLPSTARLVVLGNSLPREDQDFEICEIKQQDVSSELLVTAIDVRCNFT